MRLLSALLLLAIAAPITANAQRTIDYDYSVVTQTRIDLRDLGYPPVDVIPPDESAIRGLTTSPAGLIYGATSGRRSHLFYLDPRHGWVQPLGVLKGVTTVLRSLVVDADGTVYIGGADPGGHLLRYTPQRDEHKPIRIDAECSVDDLGVPVPGDGIYALAIDRARHIIYGLTTPTARFFSYSIDRSKFAVHGGVADRPMPGEKFEKDRNIGRELAIGADGVVYGSGDRGALFRFVPGAAKPETLSLTAPTVPGREVYNRIDCWAQGNDVDDLYGGTSDGYLFRFNPKAQTIDNLGKPLNQYRIRGLAWTNDGRLYGVGGDDGDMARLFFYDPSRGAYEMLGMVDVNHRPYYAWQAYVIDALTMGNDGTLYLGQSERKSKLYLYYPESHQ